MTAEADTPESGKVKTECRVTGKHQILNTRVKEHIVNLEDKMPGSK